MDKVARIILEFQDKATVGIDAAAAQANTAFAAIGAGVASMSKNTGEQFLGLKDNVSGTGNFISGAMSKVTSTIGNVFTGTVGVVKGAIGQMTGFITGLASHMRWASLFIGTMAIGIGKSILDMGANVEQTRVAFETLLGSGDKAGELLSWITKLSIQTPVTRVQIEDLARTFLAYGHNLDQTKLATMAVIEATSALGISEERINAITYNLGQIAASTTVSFREFRDIQKQGINTGKLLAQAVNDGQIKLEGFGTAAGVTGGATKKLTKEYGTAVTNTKEWNDQLAIAKQRLDEANKSGKAKQSTIMSLNNQIQNYNEKIAVANGTVEKFTTAQANAGKAIKKSASNLTDLTREQQEAILAQNKGIDIAVALEKQMLKTYGGAALRQVKTFSGLMSNFGDVFQLVVQRAMGISLSGEVEIGGAFDNIRNAASKLVEFLIANVDTIANFFNAFLSNKNNLIGLAGVFVGMLIPAILSIVGPIVLLGGVIGFLVTKSIPAIQKLIDHFGGLEGVTNRVKGAWDIFKGKAEEVNKKIDELKVSIGNFINDTGGIDVWKDRIKGAFGEVQGVFMSIVGIMQGVWKTIGDVVGPIIGSLIESFQQLGNKGFSLQDTLIGLGAIFAIVFSGPIISVIGTIVLIIGVLGGLAKAFDNIVMVIQGFGEIVRGVFDIVVGIFTLDGEKIKTGWFALWQGIQDVVVNFFAGIVNFVAGFIESIWNFFKSLYDRLIGKSLIPDLVDGILNAFQRLSEEGIKKIEGFTGGIKNTFTGLVGSAVSWGRDLIGNFIQGLKDKAKSLGSGGKALLEKMGLGELWQGQHGGIVPGPVGQPVPIIAHGGERITPRGTNLEPSTGTGGGVTINISGSFNLDSEARVNELANLIISKLGRQNELYRLGML